MFTGIVAEVGRVISLRTDKLEISTSRILKGVELGGSIAVNGVCLTATSFTTSSFTAGLSTETLVRSNLGRLTPGDPANLERPLGLGGELGGHLVQGHVDGTGTLLNMQTSGGSTVFRFEASPEIIYYIVEKGFIAVDGISLTITGRGPDYFEVAVVDYTRANTNLYYRKVGDMLNLEIDIMAKYAERFIQAQRSNLTLEYFKQQGF